MSKKFFLLALLLLSSNCSIIDDIIKTLKSFLQKNVGNDTIVQVMEFLRKYKINLFPNHLAKNTEAFKYHLEAIKAYKGYIEDQKNYTDMSYGLLHVSNTGCGTIAIYNVLYHITRDTNIDFASIVDNFEKDGIVFNGIMGTSAISIEEFFKKKGFKTMSSTKVEDFDKIGEETEASVVLVYNDRDNIFDSIHYMAITKTDGKFYFHNLHHSGGVPSDIGYNSISEGVGKINNGKSQGIFLVGVGKN